MTADIVDDLVDQPYPPVRADTAPTAAIGLPDRHRARRRGLDRARRIAFWSIYSLASAVVLALIIATFTVVPAELWQHVTVGSLSLVAALVVVGLYFGRDYR